MQTAMSAAMGASSRLHQSLPRLTKKILTLSLYVIVPLALILYLLSPPPIAGLSSTATSLPNDNRLKGEKQHGARTAAGAAARKQGRKAPSSPETRCDYSEGEWVPNAAGLRYNGTSCGATIKDGQNCVVNGRPDTGYMYWRWQPRGCALPPFAPAEFLELVRGRHVAFVGDSLARNQCESLVCLLGSEFPAELVQDGGEDCKFRRWAFRSHNATVSVFWSPFLVNGTEKSSAPGGLDHNRLYFDQPDERWAAEVPGMDVVVLSFGQWFVQSAMYYERGAVIGCHHCPEPNRTETGFFGVFRLAVKNALGEVIARSRSSAGREKLAVLTTFSPAHFVGEWDSPDACTRTEPYAPGENEMSYMHKEMWRTGAEEATVAAAAARSRGSAVTVEALEVTRLADMRADGHPGPYFHASPFAGDGRGGKKRERVPNDCVHWCLPGPIDTWNEILLQIVKRWRKNASSSAPPPHDAPP